MDNKSQQINLINVVLGGGFLILLLMLRSITNLQDTVFWIATVMWLYHWYFGVTFVIKQCGATEHFLELAFDFLIVGTVVSTIFWLDVPRVWFALNAAAFILAVIKYWLILKTRKLPRNAEKYVRSKLVIQYGAVLSLSAAAIVSTLYGQNLLLGILTAVFHAATIAYMIFARVYTA